MIKKIPIISNAEKEWGSKAWLQARAINVLHCICVSGYYYHYHYHYHYYCITKQVTSIIKWALIGLAYVAWAGNYLITGRARGTREGERRPPLLFSPHASSTFLLSPLLPPSPPQTKQNNNNNNKTGTCYAGYDWPYSGTFMRGPKQGKRLAGTDSSIMSSKMRKSRHLRKFNGMMQNWL